MSDAEIERYRDEADTERLARRELERRLARVREAIGDVSEDVPNWDGNSVGLAAAVEAKVGRLEAEVWERMARLRAARRAITRAGLALERMGVDRANKRPDDDNFSDAIEIIQEWFDRVDGKVEGGAIV